MIRMENLSVGYDGNAIVSDINISVEKGSVLAIIGANGTGKSTLIKTLLGQLEPVSGKAFIDDTDILSLNEAARSKLIAAVLTKNVRADYMIGFDVALQGRLPYTTGLGSLSQNDIKKTKEAFLMLQIDELFDKPFKTMSDGQKQLVMIARAIAQDTPVIILDEPENHLDIRYKLKVFSVLKHLAKEKKRTILMSIHELSYVRSLADVALCIREDKSSFSGAADEIITGEGMDALFSVDRSALSDEFKEISLI